MNTRIGLCIDRPLTDNDLSIIKNYFKEYDDFVVFSTMPRLIDSPLISTLPNFYMFFFDGILIFDEHDTIKKYVRNLMSSRIFLLTNNNLIDIDKEILTNEI